jgi:hypothetical protein
MFTRRESGFARLFAAFPKLRHEQKAGDNTVTEKRDRTESIAIGRAVDIFVGDQSGGAAKHLAEPVLADYELGILQPEEADLVRDHIAACSECSSKLLIMKDARLAFERRELDFRGDAQQERSVVEELAGSPWVRAPESPALGWRRAARALAAAASLLLALGGGWYIGTSSALKPEPNVHLVDLTPLDELPVERGALLSSGVAQEIRLPADSKSLVLNLNVSNFTSYDSYLVEIYSLDTDPPNSGDLGDLVWSSESVVRLQGGTFRLSIPSSFLDDATYALRVSGRKDSTVDDIAWFSFRFLR